MKKIKNVFSVLTGTGLAVTAFYMPEVLAVPTSPDIPIGSVIDHGEDADVMVTKIFGWLMMFVGMTMGVAAFAGWGYGLFKGFLRLTDENDKQYSIGNWVTILVVGLVMVAIVAVIGFYVFNFGKDLAGL